MKFEITLTWSKIVAVIVLAAARLPSNLSNPVIKLDYVGMGARTAASDAAVGTLTINHYVVTTN